MTCTAGGATSLDSSVLNGRYGHYPHGLHPTQSFPTWFPERELRVTQCQLAYSCEQPLRASYGPCRERRLSSSFDSSLDQRLQR
jgi:hypothetical protein